MSIGMARMQWLCTIYGQMAFGASLLAGDW